MRELEEEEEEASTLCSGIRERDRTYIERGEEGESGIWLGSRKRRLNDPGCALWQREGECATMVFFFGFCSAIMCDFFLGKDPKFLVFFE